VVLEAHPDFFSGYYSRSYLKRELDDLAGAEQDYLLARAEEAKARKVATVDPEPYASSRESDKAEQAGDKQAGSQRGEGKDTREQADRDIEKFNLLVVSKEDTSSKSKYQRQSRGQGTEPERSGRAGTPVYPLLLRAGVRGATPGLL